MRNKTGAFVVGLLGLVVAIGDAQQSVDQFSIGGSTLTVQIAPTQDPFFKKALLDWVQTSARGVSVYYGRFPVPDVLIKIHVVSGDRIDDGVTYGGRRIDIRVGKNTSPEALGDDWELTHEMFHLAFPLLDEEYDWMGEGFSDYLEPIARVHNRTMREKNVWAQFVDGFPKGLPKRGDQGLDGTRDWGRLYWGGAFYWFMADLEIRMQTQNRHSLHDAAQAILDAGGNGRTEWNLEQVFIVGDRATGTTVLRDLHRQMGEHLYKPDLGNIWSQLGVKGTEDGVVFDDRAPLASMRKAILQT